MARLFNHRGFYYKGTEIIRGLKSLKSELENENQTRYRGRGPADAATVIDNSQGRRGENAPSPGHPRGHVSNPTARGPQDSVERYSFTGPKTGFFKKEDQDKIVHEFLVSEGGQRVLDFLNEGSNKEALTKSISEYNLTTGEWLNGELLEEFAPKEAVLVLQHQQGMKREREADVHILTCYPKRRRTAD